MTERELIFLEYQFDTNQADAVYKACQTKLLGRIKKNQSQSQQEGQKSSGPDKEHKKQKSELVYDKDQRRMQVYAQVSGLKRQTLQSAYMIDQEA